MIISVLNISEIKQEINIGQVNKISYECDIENDTDEIKIVNNDSERVNKIRDLIRSDHLNKEERESIIKICEQYADIFYLENDYLTMTTAAEHVIKLPENQAPIYKKPYRLPHAQIPIIEEELLKWRKMI